MALTVEANGKYPGTLLYMKAKRVLVCVCGGGGGVGSSVTKLLEYQHFDNLKTVVVIIT